MSPLHHAMVEIVVKVMKVLLKVFFNTPSAQTAATTYRHLFQLYKYNPYICFVLILLKIEIRILKQ